MKRVVVLSSLWAIVGVVVTCWMSWFVNFCASFRKPQPYKLNPGSTHTLMFLLPPSMPPSPHTVQNQARKRPSLNSSVPLSIFFFCFLVLLF